MDYIAIYPETIALIKRYNEAQRCRLYEAMFEYSFTGAEPSWPDDAVEWYGWEGLKQCADRAKARSEQARANGGKRKQLDANESESKPTEAKSSKTKQSKAKATELKQRKAKANSESESESDTESDKEILNTTTARACARTAFGVFDVDELQNYAQQYLTGLTSTHLEELSDYEDILNTDLVKHAIDEAVANSVRSWSYVRAILQGYIKSGIKTVAQAEHAKEMRKKVTTPQGRQVTAQQYTQREYTEDELEARAADLLNEAMGVTA